MLKKITSLICFLMTLASFSQTNEPMLSLHDLIPGGKTFNKYRANMPQNIRWWGDKLIYTKGDSIIQIPVNEKGKESVVLSKESINTDLRTINIPDIKNINRLSFDYPESEIISFYIDNTLFLYDFKNKKKELSISIPKNAENIDFSTVGRTIAYTINNNLYVKTKDDMEIAISDEENKAITYGGNNIHRNEFGIAKGTFWSPNGKFLAFYRMDETMVEDYPLVDISARQAKLKNIKYPMAGMKSHQVTVGVFNLETKQTIYLKTGTPKDKYLTNIAWSPDESSVYIAELNRGQDTCMLNRYNAVTGKLEASLFSETNEKYVEPQHPILFLPNNPQQFIYQSQRGGYNHLYLYDTSGKLIKQITTGEWAVTDVIGLDVKGENIFILSKEISPIEEHLYKVNIKTGKRIQLSKEAGVHRGLLNSSGRYIADIYTSKDNAGKVAVTNTKSNTTFIYHTARNPYKDIPLPEITLGSLKTNDGETDLYYRLVKPINFDPNKKYPTIIYVYGGPHSQMVTNSWLGQVRGWDIFMAEKGYVVFTLDNRGTSGRGFDFESITHRQLGILETQDQMTGIEFLKSQSFVDSDRIGVHGWSYGGFMTLNLMLRYPEVFKVGVAGGPVTDWKYYEIMYGERYMDSPKENTEGYEETSMVNKSGNLKGRLMLIHGDEDPVVVMQHSLQFLKSSIKNGTHPNFFIYPGQEHNMTGADRIHLHEHITRYFEDFLK